MNLLKSLITSLLGITTFYWFILLKKKKFNISTIVLKQVELLKVIHIRLS